MASSSSSSLQQKHQVFLSFRGEDTRNNFISHLYAALKRKGIDTFIDNQLVRGEEITSALLKAIKESQISIIVLSKNYASSSFCLEELSMILECKERNEQKVVPIFYHVDPSYIRNLKGTFAEAFAEHVKKRADKVEGWRLVLKKVADLAGYHLDVKQNRPESTIIEEIAKEISEELKYKSLYDTKCLVGIDSCITRIKSLLCMDSSDVQVIGICGIGGVGKTTIAEVVYNQFFADFEGCCFLNVREELKYGAIHLLNKLLSKVLEDENLNIETSSLLGPIYDRLRHKKVFIVLDDLNDFENLEFFREKHCFGPGSRIIITSREKHVLQQVVDETYEVEGLIDDEALKLFSLCAFKQNHPEEDFMKLSKKVVDYAKGLPLALKVLGSTLYGRSKSDWEEDLIRLKEIPNPKIYSILKISYDGLIDDDVRNIFLDIACFFKGEDRDYVTKILGGCYSHIVFGINVLIDKSLITISSNNKLKMHDLLQQMGWNIVRQESKRPDERSRLWTPEDIYYVLKNNKDAEVVEGMFLDMCKVRELCLKSTAFAGMRNLRLLNFYYSSWNGERRVYLPQCGLESLPDNLRYLRWDDYPSKSLPSNFCPDNLVNLKLCNSHVKRLWRGTQNLANLKWLNLSNSKHLIELPDLSRATNLEEITLWDCTSLVKVPSIINLRTLKYLYLDGCSKVTKFPEISENLVSLRLNGTAIEEVPSSFVRLSKLEFLKLENCRRLERLPSSIWKFKSLSYLNLDGCLNLKSFPEILEPMECLTWLYLSSTSIEELPSSIEHLVRLERLEVNDCKKLKKLPSSIKKLKSLVELTVRNCSNFTMFPERSKNLKSLDLSGTAIEQVPSSIKCVSKSLEHLRLGNCNLFTFPSCLTFVSSLRKLDLSGNNFETIPASIKQLLELTSLNLSYCKRLQSLPELPPNLKDLDATSCTSLEAVSSSFTIPHITKESGTSFIFNNCVKLDQNAITHILAETQLAIQHMENYDEGTLCFPTFTLCLPGNEIPKWFSYQSTGSSVTTQLAGFAECAIAGYALCAVVAFEDSEESDNFYVECEVKCYNFYRSKYHELYRSDRFVDSNNVVLTCNSCEPFHCNEISFEFSVLCLDSPTQNCGMVKKCGVHLLYAQNDPTINQRRHDKVPRGNFKSDEVEEEPQPKRLKWNSEC